MTLRLVLCPLLFPFLFAGSSRAEAPAKAHKTFALRVDAPAAQVGKPGRAEIELLPGAGMHVNTEYPTSLSVTYPGGVEAIASGKIKPTKIERTGAHFDVTFTPRESGAKSFAGTVAFVVCNDANTQCVPQREPVQFTVTVR